jgi:hypothetical protein
VLDVSHGAGQSSVVSVFGRFEVFPRAERTADRFGDGSNPWWEEAENRIQRAVVLDSAALDD